MPAANDAAMILRKTQLVVSLGLCTGLAASVPKDQTAKFDEQGAVMYFEFYEGDAKYAGSMDMFHSVYDRENNLLYMCFATADHNIRDTKLSEVWYYKSGGRPGISLKPESYQFKTSTQMFGDGKIPDLGFVGIKIDLSRHIEPVRDLLINLAPLKLGLAPTGDRPYDIKAYGYGDSGSPDRDEPDYAYVHHNRMKDEKVGTKRWYTNNASNFNVKSSIYDFDGMKYDLTKEGGTRNEGMGLIGDSGGAIFADDPKTMIGVFTNFDGKDVLDEGYGIKWGVNGYGVRFNETYIKGLDDACKAYAVPEPSSALILAVPVFALLIRKFRTAAA